MVSCASYAEAVHYKFTYGSTLPSSKVPFSGVLTYLVSFLCALVVRACARVCNVRAHTVVSLLLLHKQTTNKTHREREVD